MNDPAPDEFIARWRQDELTERSASQPHFNDLCRLPDPPDPITDDPKGEWFTFENGAARTTGGQDHGQQGPRAARAGPVSGARIALPGQSKGMHKDLDKAFAPARSGP